ncbi:MAG: nucleotidyltransferase family protein, partial [Lachnospiraceae bacterium]|nr:nucleotidyltransferase family protein [Lachnospiraceae bacterium]
MKTAAIITEYNPFHNGHAYQLDKVRQLSGADFILV